MCRIKHQSMRWFCDSFDSSGIDARQNMITTDLHLSADQCKSATDRGYLNLGYASNGNIPFWISIGNMAVLGLNWTLLKLTCKM